MISRSCISTAPRARVSRRVSCGSWHNSIPAGRFRLDCTRRENCYMGAQQSIVLLGAARTCAKRQFLVAIGEGEHAVAGGAGCVGEGVAEVGDAVLFTRAAAIGLTVIPIIHKPGIQYRLIVAVAPRHAPARAGGITTAAPLGQGVRPPAGFRAIFHAGHVVAGRTRHGTIPLALPGLRPLVLVIVVVVGGVLVCPAAGPALRIQPPVVFPLGVVE